MKATDAAPNPVYRPGQLLVATVVLFAAVVTLLVALSYPLLAGAGFATALATTVATAVTIDYRRRTGRAARVCLPRIDVCVTA